MPHDGDYEVGYCKPPRHTQFKKGQSGNPAGGISHSTSIFEDAAKVMRRKVSVLVNGETEKMTMREASMVAQMHKALKGDHRAFKCLLDLSSQAPTSPSKAARKKAQLDKEAKAFIKEMDPEGLEAMRTVISKFQEIQERRRGGK